MRRYISIDCMKGIAAFLIVCIHVPFPSIIGQTIVALARIAVPFFFIVSGFFLYEDKKDAILYKTQKHIKKVLILVVSANVIYLIWDIIKVMVSKESVIEYLKYSFSLNNMINLFAFNESPFGFHLWYLSAYLYVLFIYYFIIKLNILKISYYVIPLLLLSDLIFGKYALVTVGFEVPTIVIRNFIFVGIPYFLLGNLIRYKEEYFINKAISNKFLVLGMVFFSLTVLLEKYILIINDVNSTTREHYLSTSLLIITIFIFLIKNPLLFRDSILEIVGRKYSLDIYIIHPIILFILSFIISKFGGTLSYVYTYIAPFIVYLSSAICSIIYENVKKRIFINKTNSLKAIFISQMKEGH